MVRSSNNVIEPDSKILIVGVIVLTEAVASCSDPAIKIDNLSPLIRQQYLEG